KRPGDNIDNKLTFGYVILDSEKSINLEEKTNREGFIRNETSTYFTEMMDTIVTYFGLDRKNSAQKLKRLIDKSGTAKRPNLFTLNNIGTTGTTGTGTTGTGTTGTGTTGTGTTGAGTTGTGTTGTGTTGTGTTGTGTTGSIGIGRKNTYTKSTNIGFIDPNIKNNISSPKVKALINEITTINIEKYPLATGFLLRSLTEVMMDEYLRKNLSSLQSHFKDYIINNDNNIKKSFSISNGHNEKDIPIKTKLMDFKKYFSNTSKFDSRSLKHIDDLANIIDEINLAMHWTDKTIAINKLQTNWQNSVFFIEFICKSI
ncbi:MAG: hypothetical protein ABS935_14495, partial [Solibacillus sp.]|uniref:hypothetical protein n=1 Tax=Solibacillus sp. TaxID=1909654 RepID=UPI0033162B19